MPKNNIIKREELKCCLRGQEGFPQTYVKKIIHIVLQAALNLRIMKLSIR